jgi:hypothetical protein
MPSLLPRILSWGRLFDRWLAESGHGVHHSRPLPLSILSGPGHFQRNSHWRALVFIARLWLCSVEWPAGCWRCRPFGRSRSSRPSAMEIPGMPAGIEHDPWHTPEVIPMTLAPETGEVSWVCMGLRRVLVLAEVSSLPLKSQDSLSGLKVIGLGAKPHGVPPAISKHAGSKSDPAGDC